MFSSTYEKVTLVENHGGGLRIETAKDRLELVKLLINNGAIGGGFYGDDAHKSALLEVEKTVAHARAQFREQELREELEEVLKDLPPWPNPPKGHRWEFRGKGWTCNGGRARTFANATPLSKEWDIHEYTWPEGMGYYLEAVPF